MFGLMVEDIKDNGKTIKCMDKVILIGQMENVILV
jgi:hypoxanthine-guanine phosphoribosyltransferase